MPIKPVVFVKEGVVHYVANLQRGPILLTAPHSCIVGRGGELSNTKI
jgi:hypothetical protein